MHLQDFKHEHAVALGVPQEYLNAATGSGINLQTVLELVRTYGLPILAWLAQMYGWKLPPIPLPTTPALPPAPQQARPVGP